MNNVKEFVVSFIAEQIGLLCGLALSLLAIGYRGNPYGISETVG